MIHEDCDVEYMDLQLYLNEKEGGDKYLLFPLK